MNTLLFGLDNECFCADVLLKSCRCYLIRQQDLVWISVWAEHFGAGFTIYDSLILAFAWYLQQIEHSILFSIEDILCKI